MKEKKQRSVGGGSDGSLDRTERSNAQQRIIEVAKGEAQALTPQFRQMALRAAVMQFKHGQTVQDISAQLGKSASYVSRLIKAAVNYGWVRFVVAGAPQVELEAAIISATKGRLRHVRVIETPPTEAERERALGATAAQLLDELLIESVIHTVAIGGSQAMLAVSQAVTPRIESPNVVPTSLTQVTGRLERTNAQLVATLLAAQWGAVPVEYARYVEERKRGSLYLASLGDPPEDGGLSAIAEWFRTIESRITGLGSIFDAWRETQIALIGVAPFDVANMYRDVRARFERLGVDVEELRRREVVGLLANRLLSKSGAHVFLDAAAKVPGLEVSIPTEVLRNLGSGRSLGYSMLICGGKQGGPAGSAVFGEFANCLVCDVEAGEAFLRAWRDLEMARR